MSAPLVTALVSAERLCPVGEAPARRAALTRLGGIRMYCSAALGPLAACLISPRAACCLISR
jgi:hypothetical protein